MDSRNNLNKKTKLYRNSFRIFRVNSNKNKTPPYYTNRVDYVYATIGSMFSYENFLNDQFDEDKIFRVGYIPEVKDQAAHFKIKVNKNLYHYLRLVNDEAYTLHQNNEEYFVYVTDEIPNLTKRISTERTFSLQDLPSNTKINKLVEIIDSALQYPLLYKIANRIQSQEEIIPAPNEDNSEVIAKLKSFFTTLYDERSDNEVTNAAIAIRFKTLMSNEKVEEFGISKMPVELIEEFTQDLAVTLKDKPRMSKNMRVAVYGVVGAIVGAIVGLLLGSVISYGVMGIPGGVVGALTGFTLGTELALGLATLGSVVGVATRVYQDKKRRKDSLFHAPQTEQSASEPMADKAQNDPTKKGK
ncbi:MAG: hypothetical protein H0W64_09605 [Gammaproteobacteria bacterium]|nr:hypothetical protein [Gammaproteobacteria bacterium]